MAEILKNLSGSSLGVDLGKIKLTEEQQKKLVIFLADMFKEAPQTDD